MSSYEALQLMAENDVGALLVVSKEQDLLGIFTFGFHSPLTGITVFPPVIGGVLCGIFLFLMPKRM
jgi:hypothetical protein